ncbi:MAG TPA: serine/threonine-protein kinase [Burkholderiales bacterium]|nr:serine/threonine-protein kinase [Burkholderiales bacterium]
MARMAPIEEDLVPGYTMLHKIGEGGQSTVYLAERDNDGLRVALKVLEPRLRKDPVFLERFVREHKMLASIENEHVARIYDQGVSGEHPYIAMEFLPSGTLAGRIHEGLTPRSALRLTRQIAHALEAIHARGIVHRDLKPANILFRPDGRPVIVDFGLAKDLGVNSTLTAAGRLIATPRYMSPEQCQGLPVDPRSDIYSLGVILWEMFTGSRIYEEATPAELISMHVSAPPPTLPSSLAHHQPLLERMLAKKPEDRFGRAADVAAAITL